MAALGLTIEIPGPPRGKGRPRFATIGGHAKTYTDAKTATYEKAIKTAAVLAMYARRMPKMAGPIKMEITAIMPIPDSWPKKRRAAILAGANYAPCRPDLDNIMKAALDALNGTLFEDDKQIVAILGRKIYAERGALIITAYELGDDI